MKVLFLAKEKPFSRDAAAIIAAEFPSADIHFGQNTDPFPREAEGRTYDYVFSYIAPWIVPENVLANTTIAAVNFHPGPPAYPGIGCTNFAIYNNARTYGVTAHHMERTVDTGAVIRVHTFPVLREDTVYTLTQRCYASIFLLFSEIVAHIKSGRALPASPLQWTRRPYTRKELNDLCRVTDDMDDAEVARRIRATTYPGMPGAYRVSDGKPLQVESL